MKALFYIQPPYTKAAVRVAHISFIKSAVTYNKNVTFIKGEWEYQTIWYNTIAITVFVSFANVSSNEHHNDGDNLIFIANGCLKN